MAIQLQLRRGNTTENNTFTGAVGEVTMDTSDDTLRLHDGSTLGGFKIDKSTNVVHRSGNETIAGTKTFSSDLYRLGTNPAYQIVNTNVNLPNTVSTTQYSFIRMNDTNSRDLGYLRHAYWTSNNINYSSMEIIAMDPDPTHTGSARINASINLVSTADGRRFCQYNYSPATITSATTTNEIPSMGWVNDPTKSTNVVHRSGNETIAGTKTFSSSPVIPTPSTTDNSTKAATTAFVNNKLVITNTIPSTGTNGVLYFVYS